MGSFLLANKKYPKIMVPASKQGGQEGMTYDKYVIRAKPSDFRERLSGEDRGEQIIF